MYLCYVDECGDTGLKTVAGHPFILTAVVVHAHTWSATLQSVLGLRRQLRERYGFKVREELHAHPLLFHPGDASRIAKSLRLRMLGDVLTFVGTLKDVAIVNVIVQKPGKPGNHDVFAHAWGALLERICQFAQHRLQRGLHRTGSRGLLIVDRTDENKLRQLVRGLRLVDAHDSRAGSASHHVPPEFLVEDPFHLDSHHSHFIQLADVVAYFLRQRTGPNGYVRKKGARSWFARVEPALFRLAADHTEDGIIEL